MLDGTDVPASRRADRTTILIQELLGLFCYLLFVMPFVRVVRGWSRLPEQKVVLVSNHVSLLDTILIGGVLWRQRRVPLLVLGDKAVWRATWIRRMLSLKLGFLIARDKRSCRTRVAELEAFARSDDFDRLVFPEGTRGSGAQLKRVQPGIYYVARAAQVPIVPLFIENMQLVSTKRSGFHPLRGLGKLGFHVGEPIAPESYLDLDREAFVELIRDRLSALARESVNESDLVTTSLLHHARSEPGDVGAAGG